MVEFVFFFDAPQDRNGIGHVGFIDHDRLETTLQSLIFLDVFLVFFQRGGPNRVEFTPREGRFQQVGGIHCTFAAASRANQRVDFVDEQDDLAFRVGHFFDDSFKAFFKFAFVFGTGNEQAHIERDDGLRFEVLRHVARHDALGQPFHNGGLAHAGFAKQNGVVFSAAAQDLQYPPDFFVTANNRVNFASPGAFVEVDRVAFQRLISRFGVGIFHSVVFAPKGFNGFFKRLFGKTYVFQERGYGIFSAHQTQQ